MFETSVAKGYVKVVGADDAELVHVQAAHANAAKGQAYRELPVRGLSRSVHVAHMLRVWYGAARFSCRDFRMCQCGVWHCGQPRSKCCQEHNHTVRLHLELHSALTYNTQVHCSWSKSRIYYELVEKNYIWGT